MKKILLAVASVALLQFTSVAQHHDDDKNKIEGSGNIITKDFPVQAFDEIHSGGVFNVILTQGDKEQVKIEGDDNLMDIFDVRNEGSKLILKMKKETNFNSKKGIKIYVTFRKLKHMELSMVGNVSAGKNLSFDNLTINHQGVGTVTLDLTAQTLNVDSKGVGSMKLSGKAESAVVKNKGVGSFEAADLVVQKMNIENIGVGSAVVNAEKELTVKDSFIGKVRNKGAATAKKLNKTSI